MEIPGIIDSLEAQGDRMQQNHTALLANLAAGVVLLAGVALYVAGQSTAGEVVVGVGIAGDLGARYLFNRATEPETAETTE